MAIAPYILKLYLSEDYYIWIGSDFTDATFTVGKNSLTCDSLFDVFAGSGTSGDLTYGVSGQTIMFNKDIQGLGIDFNTVTASIGSTIQGDYPNTPVYYVIQAEESKTTFDLSTLNFSEGTHTINVVASADRYRDSDASNSVTYNVQPQLAAPTIAMNSDGKTLEITDVENATSYDVYVDGTLKTNVARVFTVTIVKDQHVTGTTNITYIKKDSAPTSISDYTYHVYDGYSDPPFEANKVYIWGYGYKIDSGDAIYLNKSTYASATEITLTKDVTITLLGTEVGEPV